MGSQNMSVRLLVTLLGIAASCRGASLSGQTRLKRDADFSSEMFGVHIDIKYKDPTQDFDYLFGVIPVKEGTVHIKVDDVKKLYKSSTLKKVDVDIQLNGGDGILNIAVNYLIIHEDDEEEKGKFIFESNQRMKWRIESKAEQFEGDPTIPVKISNLNFMVDATERHKVKITYDNIELRFTNLSDPTIKVELLMGETLLYEIDWNVQCNTACLRQNRLKVADLIGRIPDEKITGKIYRYPEYRFKPEYKHKEKLELLLKKRNERYLEVEFESYFDLPCFLFCSDKTQPFLVFGFDARAEEYMEGDLELRMDLALNRQEDHELKFEFKRNGKSILLHQTYFSFHIPLYEINVETIMKLDGNSKLYKWLDANYPYGAFKTRKMKLNLSKLKLDFQLEKDRVKVVELTRDTISRPYKFKLKAPNIFKSWGIELSSLEVTADYKDGNTVIIDANILNGIHFEAQHTGQAEGDRNLLISLKNGDELISSLNFARVNLYDKHDLILLYQLKQVIRKFKPLIPTVKKISGFNLLEIEHGLQVELIGEDTNRVIVTLTDDKLEVNATHNDNNMFMKCHWEGKLPKTVEQAKAFLLKNKLTAVISDTIEEHNLGFNWNFETPEQGKLGLSMEGPDERLKGSPVTMNYFLTRKLEWTQEDQKTELKYNGEYTGLY